MISSFPPGLCFFGWFCSVLTVLLLCCTAPWLKGTGMFMFSKRQQKDKVILRATLKYTFQLTLATLKSPLQYHEQTVLPFWMLEQQE